MTDRSDVRSEGGSPADSPEGTLCRGLSRKAKLRLAVYGTIVALAWGFWVWQPWEFDFFPRPAPTLSLHVDPDRSRLFEAGTRIVVVTAHPDDSEFYVGATLLRLARAGAFMYHVVVTDGDKGYYPWEDAARNRRIRREEQRRASAAWGAREVVFLGYPDGRLQASPSVVTAIARELERLRPEYVLTFDSLYPPRLSHRDHRRAGEAVERAIAVVGGAKWLFRFSTRAPNFVVDITNDWEGKRRLLAIHASQFHGERLERVENLVSSFAEADGERIGTSLGEGFRCARLSR